MTLYKTTDILCLCTKPRYQRTVSRNRRRVNALPAQRLTGWHDRFSHTGRHLGPRHDCAFLISRSLSPPPTTHTHSHTHTTHTHTSGAILTNVSSYRGRFCPSAFIRIQLFSSVVVPLPCPHIRRTDTVYPTSLRSATDNRDSEADDRFPLSSENYP